MGISSKTLLVSLISAAVIGTGVVLAYQKFVKAPEGGGQPAETVEDPSDEGANTPESSNSDETVQPDGSGSSDETALGQLPQPVLTKSSGNSGSIPSGILVQFTCEALPGSECNLKLTEGGSGKTMDLGTKTVTDNGRGQAFATWEWQSQSGTWEIVATASKARYTSNSSPKQTLMVR